MMRKMLLMCGKGSTAARIILGVLCIGGGSEPEIMRMYHESHQSHRDMDSEGDAARVCKGIFRRSYSIEPSLSKGAGHSIIIGFVEAICMIGFVLFSITNLPIVIYIYI